MRHVHASLAIGLWLLVDSGSAGAYDPVTHHAIGVRSTLATASKLDEVLKAELGFPDGVDRLFAKPLSAPPETLQTISDLVGQGAQDEDIPLARSLNHFHNPLRAPWDAAGLDSSVLGLPVKGQSSALWQQNPAQGASFVLLGIVAPQSGGGNWAWHQARERYVRALTGGVSGTRDEQDQGFAELFVNLGHLVHLLQDASVPAHVRNDPHPPFSADGYETLVRNIREENEPVFQSLMSPSVKPSASIFSDGTGDARAPVPVARLVDTRRLLSAGIPALTEPALGIAEYTNGNFLSQDTKFSGFTWPAQSSLGAPFLVDVPGGKRQYFPKVGDGQAIAHFVAEGMLYSALAPVTSPFIPRGGWVLDRRVQTDYAIALLPRAVGYSAALLDYFFRRRLDVRVEFARDDPEHPDILQLVGSNASSEMLDRGRIAIYAEDSTGNACLFGRRARCPGTR